MERIRETADCKSLGVFLWNEKLTRNQISQSEGLCVFIIKSTFMMIQPCECGCSENQYTIEAKECSSVIPFDLSKLRNREASLGSMLVSATLQFLPQTIKQLGNDISFRLFTKFQDSQALLPSPRPTYVVAIEICQTRCINFTDKTDINISPNFTGYPPDIPLYRRFGNDYKEKKGVFPPFCKYTEYLDILREYTGEGGTHPTKPPIAADVARGFIQVQPCNESWCPSPSISIKDLIDETCPICRDKFKDENEVIATYCSHAFHISCLLLWLSKNNTCPTCRAVYPLHYSPLLDSQCRKRKHNMVEADV